MARNLARTAECTILQIKDIIEITDKSAGLSGLK